MPQEFVVDFGTAKSIYEIDFIGLPTDDNRSGSVQPNLTETSVYANSAYTVDYWNGSAWVNLASETVNDKLWKRYTFSTVSTTKIRVNITAAGGGHIYASGASADKMIVCHNSVNKEVVLE